MKNYKKNLITAAILVTVCAGIYLNWVYSEGQSPDLTQTLNADKLLSDDLLVMGTEPLKEALSDQTGSNTSTDYFAAVRLSRQEARDSAVTLLQEAMAYTEGDEAAQSSAQLEDIVQTALCEAQIESLIIAKGYADCVAYMNEEGISVAVAAPEQGLQQEDVAVITDIVLTQSDYSLEDIRVVQVP